MARRANGEESGKKKKGKRGQVAHVRWSEHDEVKEFEVPTPDKSAAEPGEFDKDGGEEEEEEEMGEFSSASNEEVYAAKVLNLLRSSLQTHERRHQSKVYSKCFSGVQMVDWLVETMDEDKLRFFVFLCQCSVGL